MGERIFEVFTSDLLICGMKRVLQSALLICGLLNLGVGAQYPSAPKTELSYSESASYTPRVFPVTSDPKENGSKSKVSAGAVGSGVSQLTISVGILANDRTSKQSIGPGDFKVFIDDRETEIVSVETRSDPLNVILLVDTSPSADVHLKNVKSLAHSFVKMLGQDDRVMVFGFNHELKAYSPLTADRGQITKAIDRLRMGDGTSLYNAIKRLSEKELFGMQGPTALVVMTDGVDTTSKDANYQTSLTAIEKTNAVVFPVYFDTLAAIEQRYLRGGVMISGNRGVVVGPPGSPVIVPGPPGVNSKGSLPADYERGRTYLTDLVLLSGGRPVRGDELGPGRMESLERLPSEITSRHYVTFRLRPGGKPGERHRIKVRINKPNLTVLAKGSYIDQ